MYSLLLFINCTLALYGDIMLSNVDTFVAGCCSFFGALYRNSSTGILTSSTPHLCFSMKWLWWGYYDLKKNHSLLLAIHCFGCESKLKGSCLFLCWSFNLVLPNRGLNDPLVVVLECWHFSCLKRFYLDKCKVLFWRDHTTLETSFWLKTTTFCSVHF